MNAYFPPWTLSSTPRLSNSRNRELSNVTADLARLTNEWETATAPV
jgi:hypothetical protein